MPLTSTPPNTSVDTLLMHARQLHQSGDLKAAKVAYQHILESQPEHVASLSLLGRLCAQTGEWLAAEKCLRAALALSPQYAEAIETLALVYETQGDLNRANKLYQQAVSIHPKNASLQNNYGDLLRKLGHLEEGRQHLQQAVALQPKFAIAHNNLGVCLQALKIPDAAEQAFRSALDIDPRYKRARRNLGGLLLECLRHREASEQLEQALALDPNDAETLSQYALALINQHRLEEAAQTLRASLKLAPNTSQNWVNLGLTLQELGELTPALDAFDRAIKLAPTNLQAQWHRAFTHFLLGNWPQAWEDYEVGIALGTRPGLLPNIPIWRGEPLDGKHLALIGEQGLGDEIMFASCVQELALQAAHTTLSSDRRLVPVFARAFPSAHCVLAKTLKRNAKKKTNPLYDYQILTGSLPHLLRKTPADYPRQSYLNADPERIARWQERYASLGAGPKIGISWRGGLYYSGEKRSTELGLWSQLLQTPGAHFVNVQYGTTAEELAELQAMSGTHIHHWQDSDPLKEQEDFAAQLCALDLLISVTNATVHLAGALGLNTWTLLSHVPSWRWTMDGNTSRWYPNVTLYRQPRRGDWDSVFAHVQHDLAQLLTPK